MPLLIYFRFSVPSSFRTIRCFGGFEYRFLLDAPMIVLVSYQLRGQWSPSTANRDNPPSHFVRTENVFVQKGSPTLSHSSALKVAFHHQSPSPFASTTMCYKLPRFLRRGSRCSEQYRCLRHSCGKVRLPPSIPFTCRQVHRKEDVLLQDADPTRRTLHWESSEVFSPPWTAISLECTSVLSGGKW